MQILSCLDYYLMILTLLFFEKKLPSAEQSKNQKSSPLPFFSILFPGLNHKTFSYYICPFFANTSNLNSIIFNPHWISRMISNASSTILFFSHFLSGTISYQTCHIFISMKEHWRICLTFTNESFPVVEGISMKLGSSNLTD